MPFVKSSVDSATKVLCAQHVSDDVVYEAMTILKHEPELIDVLANPSYHQADKDRVIAKIFPEALVPYLTVICRNGGFGDISEILHHYIIVQEMARGHGIGTLWYAGDKPDDQALAKLVADKFGIADIQWVIHKDPSLIGGFKIQINNYVYDHSVAGAFAELSHKLTEVRP